MAGRQALATFSNKDVSFATVHKAATTSAPFAQLEVFNAKEVRETVEAQRISDPSKNKAIVGKQVTGSATLFHADNPKEIGYFFGNTQPTAGGWLGSEKFTMAASATEKGDYYIAMWDSTITASASLTSVILIDDLQLDDWGIDMTAGQPIKYTFTFTGVALELTPTAGIGA